MDPEILKQISVSLGLGLLLGLQRERTDHTIAGIRTFPFISLFGTLCAYIGAATGTWIIAAGLLALAGLLVTANLASLRETGEVDTGTTTEVAALLVYVLGVLVGLGQMAVPVVVAGGMALLLHFKAPMHKFARSMGEKDMLAILRFVVISLIILPVLPDEAYGPYEVLNPFRIWLMVVLIVGIGLVGYVAYKIFGSRTGTLLGGILGGLISSTATTVTYSRRAKSDPSIAPLAAFVIMIASCVSLARVLFILGAVAAPAFLRLAPPLGTMLLACSAIAAVQYVRSSDGKSEMPEQENPTELKPAIVFAALYGLVLLGIAYAKDHFGDSGLYGVAALSGLTDMDAITLSTGQLAAKEHLSATVAWRAILIGAMANFVFKFGVVVFLGNRHLALRVGIVFALSVASGILILWFWPAASGS